MNPCLFLLAVLFAVSAGIASEAYAQTVTVTQVESLANPDFYLRHSIAHVGDNYYVSAHNLLTHNPSTQVYSFHLRLYTITDQGGITFVDDQRLSRSDILFVGNFDDRPPYQISIAPIGGNEFMVAYSDGDYIYVVGYGVGEVDGSTVIVERYSEIRSSTTRSDAPP